LTALRCLSPGPEANKLFGRLVQLCTRTPDGVADRILYHPQIQAIAGELRSLSACGERLLEEYWARAISGSDEPQAELERFPYLDNYRDLIELELGALVGSGADLASFSRVLFIGGGPLPLSALFLRRRLNGLVTVVDRSGEAVQAAHATLDAVGESADIVSEMADAGDPELMRALLAETDVVFLAALVGLDEGDKRQVLRTVRAGVRPGTYVVVRSANCLRGLLYPVVGASDLESVGLKPLCVVHPFGEIVNSVLVARS
jgi:nicotianamine synthase